jgi:molecular chaperone DnaK (HSP70)
MTTATESPAFSRARHVVGIDLGTSHTVVAHAPLDGSAQIALLAIPQRTAAGEVDTHPLLPSVRYQAAVGELPADALALPWPALGATDVSPAIVGRYARELGAAVPGRVVASAKSWLSHAGVDRSAPILPWGAPEGEGGVAKISPLLASASYLAHVRDAWDTQYPDAPLAQQRVVLTVPASFDEGARALTLEAAQLAGLQDVHLLEEPKAAFHDWLVLQGDQVGAALQGSHQVLVVDVGGGTTDLTLIRVDAPESPGGVPVLTRTGVGEHLMLGGDNMDLALAHLLEPQLSGEGRRLPPARFAQLVQRCRSAKEQLLSAEAPESVAVTLLGAGSQLLAQTRSATLTRAQVQQCTVEGFLPPTAITDLPRRRQNALTGLGLPYPAEAAITRHLAEFLTRHCTETPLPDTVLLNGGVFHAPALAERLVTVLSAWRGAPVRVLHNPHPDYAVARGAAAHGLARWQAEFQSNQALATAVPALAAMHKGASALPAIGGGAPRSYLLVLPAAEGARPQGVCLLARGTPEGTRVVLSGRRFALRLGQAVQFALVATSRHQGMQPGQIVPLEGDGFVALPPLAAVLPRPEGSRQSQVEVLLHTTMTEVGTLQVRCVAVYDAAQEWTLAFATRGASKNIAGSVDVEGARCPKDPASAATRLPEAVAQIDRIFGNQAQDVTAKDVRQLRATLERLLGPREAWALPLLRALFDALLARAKRRRRSAEHERVWFNLAGWCLRPGVGAALDDWRMGQVWALYAQDLAHAQDAANRTEWWVFWRRVAAGLGEAQQMRLLEDVAGHMQQAVQRHQSKTHPHGSYDDMLRLFAAVEAVPWQYRQEMGQWMLQRLAEPGESVQTWWAIGRLCARTPLAANAHQTMPPEAVAEFLNATLAQDWRKNDTAMFAAVQMARLTGDRARDLPDETRAQVLDKLRAAHAPARWVAMVEQVQQMDAQDAKRSYGDSLPPGLVLVG